MKTIIVMCVSILGCAASSEDDPGCHPRVGSYVQSYAETSGSCGPLSDDIVQISANPEPNPICEGEVWSATELNCKTTGFTTCTLDDGRKITNRGTCRWNGDGSGGTCETQMMFIYPDGSVACSSLYVTTFRRQ
jgi:hypothetical protein